MLGGYSETRRYITNTVTLKLDYPRLNFLKMILRDIGNHKDFADYFCGKMSFGYVHRLLLEDLNNAEEEYKSKSLTQADSTESVS